MAAKSQARHRTDDNRNRSAAPLSDRIPVRSTTLTTPKPGHRSQAGQSYSSATVTPSVHFKNHNVYMHGGFGSPRTTAHPLLTTSPTHPSNSWSLHRLCRHSHADRDNRRNQRHWLQPIKHPRSIRLHGIGTIDVVFARSRRRHTPKPVLTNSSQRHSGRTSCRRHRFTTSVGAEIAVARQLQLLRR